MAKQNFLAGGYYGKLGDTVGQRWRNIRTVRAYVVPSNPRTQAQQANRGKFGDCVFYAQLSRQMQGKAIFFQSGTTTEWNGRMSAARSLQDNGFTELNRIPLYPTGFTPNYLITGANISEVVDETHIKVTVEGNLPESKRVFTMIVKIPELGDFPENLALCEGENSESDLNVITFRLPENLSLSENMECRIVSCDDVSTTDDLICSSQIPLSYVPIDVHEFDTSFVSLSRSGNNYTLTLGEPYQEGTNSVTVDRLREVNNGAWEQLNSLDCSLINNGGNFAISFTCPNTDNQNLWAFPSGGAIRISSISSRSSTVIATAENKSLSISNSDLSRTYDNRISSVERSGDTFTFAYAKQAPTSTSGSGSISIRAVKNGAWVNYIVPSYHATKNNVSFQQGESDTQKIFAFPSGATFTENLTRIGNGVTYSPSYTTAQAVSNTDLTRELTLTDWAYNSSENVQEMRFTIDGTFTNKQDISISADWYDNRHILLEKQTNPFVWTVIDSVATLQVSSYQKFPAFSGSYVQLKQTLTAVANGVTYQVSPFKKEYTQVGISYINASLLGIVGSDFSDTTYSLYAEYDSSIHDAILADGWNLENNANVSCTTVEGYKGSVGNFAACYIEHFNAGSVNRVFFNFEDGNFTNGNPPFPSAVETETDGTLNLPNSGCIIVAPDGSKFDINAVDVDCIQITVNLE